MRHNLLKGLIVAGVVALLASAGGSWGVAFGQTAPPAPGLAPGVPSWPTVAPPPASQYRPAPQDTRTTGENPATAATPLGESVGPQVAPTSPESKIAPTSAESKATSVPGTVPQAATSSTPHAASSKGAEQQPFFSSSRPLMLLGVVVLLSAVLYGVRQQKP